jgi:hypothetical protein
VVVDRAGICVACENGGGCWRADQCAASGIVLLFLIYGAGSNILRRSQTQLQITPCLEH